MGRGDDAAAPASGTDRGSGGQACEHQGGSVDTDSWSATSERSLLERARGVVDTSDLVHENLQRTFTHLTSFKSSQAKVLRVYLRCAVENRIRDELRRATLRQGIIVPGRAMRASAAAPQLA